MKFQVTCQFLLLTALASAQAAAPAAAPSFRNEVQPILTRFGCAMGACHGAAAGQGGFRLSLRGFDDQGDWLSLTHSSNGRRILLEDPARSLLLLKATEAVPHKGGQRFSADSASHQVLLDWIAAGAPGPSPSDARIVALEANPPQWRPKAGERQALRVMAAFSDGSRRDVTAWCKFNASHASVATVDEQGLMSAQGPGEGMVSAWFLSRLAVVTVSSPQPGAVDEPAFAQLAPRNLIDRAVLNKLRQLNIPPSGRASDAEFLRRAHLDCIGVLPSVAETRAFLADSSPDKRDRLIESLLKRPEFVDYWAHRWSDLLLVNGDKLTTQAMWSYYQWIRRQVEANTPWDALVRQLLTATGSTLENGAGNFFVLNDEPTKCAETVSVAFMGTSIGCAKCHNHPLEKWTYEQYYAFANLYARVRAKNGEQAEDRVLLSDTRGDLIAPLLARALPPQPLEGGRALSLEDGSDRRIALADWLTSPQNKLFARSIVNRVWANFFGSGLVEPVDDLRLTNPASNEVLFAELAAQLVRDRYDLKALMRLILQSQTYQRSSEALPANAKDLRYGSHHVPRRLKAEVLLDAASQVTGVPTEFKLDRRNANRGTAERYPAGFRALQLPDSNIANYFLKSFGRADRIATCECERSNDPSMAQALHLSNGDTLQEKLTQKNNRVDALLKLGDQPAAMFSEAYLSALCREPSARESKKLLALWQDCPAAERRALLEDVLWGLMSSREFLFTH